MAPPIRLPHYGDRPLSRAPKADLIAVNGGSSWVMTSTGSAFSAPALWLNVPFYGVQGTVLGDVNGDKKADLVALSQLQVWVAASTGSAFSSPAIWF